jgi:CheY-like chemotaxis protein
MLSHYPGRHDYQVSAAFNVTTGLAKAFAGGYSIILFDIVLPGPDGFEVLRRLRAAASRVYDLWKHQPQGEISDSFSVNLPAHRSSLIRVSARS